MGGVDSPTSTLTDLPAALISSNRSCVQVLILPEPSGGHMHECLKQTVQENYTTEGQDVCTPVRQQC